MDAYILKHKNEEIRMASRSGGAFTALSDYILSQNGVVYGCAMNDENKAVHKRAETECERNAFRGSKYVQSDLNGCFRKVYLDLKNDKYVLFSGTPCQIAGLYSYLQCKNANSAKLYTCSILCHYVTSPLLLSDYIQRCENRFRGKVESFDFRNKKKYGWSEHRETVSVNGKEHDSTEYTIGFYSGVSARESCFRCPYKTANLPGNITLGDAWGIEKEDGDFNDNRGVSLVLLQDEKGEELFEKSQQSLLYRRVNIENYNKQKTFHEPYKRPDNKDAFWSTYYEHSYQKAYNRFLRVPLKTKVLRKLKKLLLRG